MASSVHSTHLPPLGEPHQRDEVGQQLQATLVELVDLSLLGKQLHWNVVGPLFRPLHLQLDELIDSWRALADTVAERAVAIGFSPDGQSGTIGSESPVRGVKRGELEDRVVVHELTARLAEVAERARDRMDRLGELDAASQDAVIEVVGALEEQLWMMRAQFPAAHRG
ncbi:MAG: DNA starvation/stationary phase protection protein [Solirubrobacterales bacterium]|nr:DNA starvation/stationary phase protection protein [Solirubrobacterales bacterium]